MVATGGGTDARIAPDWGLINEVVPDTEPGAAVARKASEIANKSPAAVRYGKAVF